MSAGKPMYFLWRLNVIHAPGWRSLRMGKISCYVIGSISASIDRGITFLDGWSAYMHGGLGFPWMWWMWRTYWTDCNRDQSDQGCLDSFKGPDPNWSRVRIKSKDETWFESWNGALEAEYVGKEWWGKVCFMTIVQKALPLLQKLAQPQLLPHFRIEKKTKQSMALHTTRGLHWTPSCKDSHTWHIRSLRSRLTYTLTYFRLGSQHDP